MPERRDENLDGAIRAVQKYRNLLAEREADLENALREAQENETTNANQVEEAKALLPKRNKRA